MKTLSEDTSMIDVKNIDFASNYHRLSENTRTSKKKTKGNYSLHTVLNNTINIFFLTVIFLVIKNFF